jgi:hypothetical protein
VEAEVVLAVIEDHLGDPVNTDLGMIEVGVEAADQAPRVDR